jgi:biotin carboxyl carrier protein
MPYTVRFRDSTHRLEVQELPSGRYRVLLDGRALEVDLCEPQPGLLSLIIEGRSYEIDVDGTPGRTPLALVIRGDRYAVDVIDERQRPPMDATAHLADGPQDVRSPMAGSVRLVLVAEDDLVEKGSPLLILEAMKMQNEIRSPTSGRVAAVSVCAGVTVAAGDPLVLVVPAPSKG